MKKLIIFICLSLCLYSCTFTNDIGFADSAGNFKFITSIVDMNNSFITIEFQDSLFDTCKIYKNSRVFSDEILQQLFIDNYKKSDIIFVEVSKGKIIKFEKKEIING